MRLSRNRKNVNAAKVRERQGGGREREGGRERTKKGIGEGQGSLACCSSWDHKESDTI